MRVNAARRSVILIYLAFGVVSMSWVPRLPEIKVNIGESTATFGALTGLGTVGAILAMFISSRLLHTLGSRQSTLIFGTLTFTLMMLIPHQHHPILYGINIALYGASSSALSTSLNIQSLAIEEARGVPSISGLHAAWATGATVGCFASSLAVPHIPLALHLDVLAVAGLLVLWLEIKNLFSHSEEGKAHDQVISGFDLFRPEKRTFLIGLAFVGGSFAEWAMGDWAAIYAHEILKSSLSTAAFTFTFIMVAITTARLIGDRVVIAIGPVRTVQIAATLIFGGLALVSLAGHVAGHLSKPLVMAVALLGFALTGLGSGAVVPNFISAITTIEGTPRALALGQVILIQQAGISVAKIAMAWTVGKAGLQNAILIPGAFALLAFAYAKLTSKSRPTMPLTEQ